MVNRLIRSHIDGARTALGLPDVPYTIERTNTPTHGDYASNIALRLSLGKLGIAQGKLPTTIAEEIVEHMGRVPFAQRVEAADPGFINFYLSPKWLTEHLDTVATRNWPELAGEGRQRRVLIEYVSANPTGPLHIGNARSGPLGDSLGRVLTLVGCTVSREYIVNDVGGQVEKLGHSLLVLGFPERRSQKHNVPLEYTGPFYEELARHVRQELEQERGVAAVSSLSEGELVNLLVQAAMEINSASIKKDCEDLGCTFDRWEYESRIAKEKTAQAVARLQALEAAVEREGALWLSGNEGDRESVLVKQDGGYTYFANDIAYHLDKFERGFDTVINVWGSNHHGHVPRMQAALSVLGIRPEWFKVLLYQFVRVKRGDVVVRMSKRLGTFVTAREVLDEVGPDAMRFFLLSRSPETHLDFDLELAKRQSAENPVYAVQYAYARMSSILRKITSTKFQDTNKSQVPNSFVLDHPSELALMKKLVAFPEIITEIASSFSVHLLTQYATELARLFHQFYELQRVIGEREDEMEARLRLVIASRAVLAHTLYLLGVTAPERMER